ncbi:MAG: hypothetical protein HOW73_43395 [Polyangiaceae bacterium]|nr:hypothetical protein [Polyangiaceae bacterium]
MTYAKGTSVSVEKSRAELDRILMRAGAAQRVTGSDDDAGLAYVGFTLSSRQVRLRIPMPKRGDFAKRPANRSWRAAWGPEQQAAAWEQACRERWRVFVLLVKAKLEAIELNLSTVEREFLADVQLLDGRSVHEFLQDGIAEMYRTGKPLPLLGPAVHEPTEEP